MESYYGTLEKILNDIERLEDHPHWTSEQKRSIKRGAEGIHYAMEIESEKSPEEIDLRIKGVFMEVLSNITFWNEGYTAQISHHPGDNFLIISVAENDFDRWVEEAQELENALNDHLNKRATFVTSDHYTVVIRKS